MSVSMGAGHIFEVRQGEIGMVSRRRGILRRDTLFTVGLNPCIGVLLWDDNWVVLGHLQDSRQTTFEASYQAVIDKMRADAGGIENSVIYGGIAYYQDYDATHADHRGPLRTFLTSAGVALQRDIIASRNHGGSGNVAVSRAIRLEPETKTYVAYVIPAPIVFAGPLGHFRSRDIRIAALPCITIVTGANAAEIYDPAGLGALALGYGR
jgi:hypothetical protein